jgi:hypothetical protein
MKLADSAIDLWASVNAASARSREAIAGPTIVVATWVASTASIAPFDWTVEAATTLWKSWAPISIAAPLCLDRLVT